MKIDKQTLGLLNYCSVLEFHSFLVSEFEAKVSSSLLCLIHLTRQDLNYLSHKLNSLMKCPEMGDIKDAGQVLYD